jgi:hypothetical protein
MRVHAQTPLSVTIFRKNLRVNVVRKCGNPPAD